MLTLDDGVMQWPDPITVPSPLVHPMTTPPSASQHKPLLQTTGQCCSALVFILVPTPQHSQDQHADSIRLETQTDQPMSVKPPWAVTDRLTGLDNWARTIFQSHTS